jgi:condensin complex subunit 3
MCQGAPGKRRASQPSEPPEVLIPRTLNECQHTQTAHIRTIKELVKCRSENRETFLSSLCNSLRPIFLIQEKEPSVERVVRYVSAFAAYRDEEHAEDCNSFVEDFLKYLLVLVDAANKTVRFRASQLIAEVNFLFYMCSTLAYFIITHFRLVFHITT